MKKALSIALALSMAAGLLTFSAAAAPVQDVSKMSVEQVANLDISRAAGETREAILAARSEIIYGDQAWSLDGKGAIVNLEDGTVTPVAKFEDLFPGWDVPEYNPPCEKNLFSGVAHGVLSASDIVNKTIYLKLASATEYGVRIARFNGSGADVGAFANTAPRNATYNLCVFEGDESLGWYPSLVAKTGIVFGTSSRYEYSVHASAADQQSVGSYRMIVTENIDDYSDVDFSELT